MRRVEQVIYHIKESIENKKVLEVACGCAEFSYYASFCACEVKCVDLDGSRIKLDFEKRNNLTFQIMDATKLDYHDNSFDTVVLYNAAGHLEEIMDEVLMECRRVVKYTGVIYIISSFKMDKRFLQESLLQKLHENVEIQEIEPFLFVKISGF